MQKKAAPKKKGRPASNWNRQRFSISFREDLHEKVIKDAEKYSRSLSGQIEFIVKLYYSQKQ